MPRQKKLNNDLVYILGLLSKKREELISPFLAKEPEWIELSFKYEIERNQAAFDLVREAFITLWIDKHFPTILTDEIPDNVKRKALRVVSNLIDARKTEMDDSSIIHSLLSTKLSVIKELLRNEDSINAKFNKLRVSYIRDKALFEREFRKNDNEKGTRGQN